MKTIIVTKKHPNDEENVIICYNDIFCDPECSNFKQGYSGRKCKMVEYLIGWRYRDEIYINDKTKPALETVRNLGVLLLKTNKNDIIKARKEKWKILNNYIKRNKTCIEKFSTGGISDENGKWFRYNPYTLHNINDNLFKFPWKKIKVK